MSRYAIPPGKLEAITFPVADLAQDAYRAGLNDGLMVAEKILVWALGDGRKRPEATDLKRWAEAEMRRAREGGA